MGVLSCAASFMLYDHGSKEAIQSSLLSNVLFLCLKGFLRSAAEVLQLSPVLVLFFESQYTYKE